LLLHRFKLDLILSNQMGYHGEFSIRHHRNHRKEPNMSTIHASVGRDGVNQPDDVRIVQEFLNKHLQPSMQALDVDGIAGPKTIAAIEEFQQRVVQMIRPDGRVDPGGRTITALSSAPNDTSSSPALGLPAVCGGAGLTQADFKRAAEAVGCEVASLKAVTEVESSGRGFLASGRPKILFEAHIFSRQTQHQYDATHGDISSRRPNRLLYLGGEREYGRLEKAMALKRQAALESASWGLFQIMGFNYQSAGFSSVDAFVEAMFESEARHLEAFTSFLRSHSLDAPLREKSWEDFARGYNGENYAANQYDVKLKAAYKKYSEHT
jgi:hypothetical protein